MSTTCPGDPPTMTGSDRMDVWIESDLDTDDPSLDDWDDEDDGWDDDEGPDELEFGEEKSGGWGDDDADEGTGW